MRKFLSQDTPTPKQPLIHTQTQTQEHRHPHRYRKRPTQRRECIRSCHAINQHSSSHINWHVIFKRTFPWLYRTKHLTGATIIFHLSSLRGSWQLGSTFLSFVLQAFRMTGKFQPEQKSYFIIIDFSLRNVRRFGCSFLWSFSGKLTFIFESMF